MPKANQLMVENFDISTMWNKSEQALFTRLKTPAAIQSFLNTIPLNFEKRRETCMSPRAVLERKLAHCMEGALLAAAILEFHGYKPYVLDLRAKRPDDDHVVAVFKVGKYFGAISKTNHAVLRYREPIYASIRELALSYFHEYFTDDGKKTLREYSLPVDLNRFNKRNWRISKEDLFEIPHTLDKVKHYSIVPKSYLRKLRQADPIEIKAGKLREWTINRG
jgi:hypothetical protein